jgi:hypothetical protein
MNIYRFYDGKQFRTFRACQKKTDHEEKRVYQLFGNKWEMVYKGNIDGMGRYLKHQKELAEKADARGMIADMCGTSYAAARRDMGL